MDPRIFPSAKRTILHKLKIAIDYSPKGSIDEGIVNLVHYINKLPDYVTTSSCAGRIALYGYHSLSDTISYDTTNDSVNLDDNGSTTTDTVPKSTSTKGQGKWIYVNHGTASYNVIQQAIDTSDPSITDDKSSGSSSNASSSIMNEIEKFPYVTLLVEPFILHTQCATIEAARKLHRIAMETGYRESGIGIGGKGKIIVAVRSTTGMLEIPLRYNNDTLINHEILAKMVNIANDTYLANEKRRERFESLLKKEFVMVPDENVGLSVSGKPCKEVVTNASTILPTTNTSVSSNPSVSCSTCGKQFPSRNVLFKNHLIPSASETGKRVCPEPYASVSADSSKSPLCTTCKKTFSSRNALFRHIKMKDKECVVSSSNPPTTTTKNTATSSSDSSGEGRQIAQEVHAVMKRYLTKVHTEQEAFHQNLHQNKANDRSIFSPTDTVESSSTDIPSELFYRWGHTATALSSNAAVSDPDPVHDTVAVFAGYVGAGIHGRRNDILLYHNSRWHVPTILPNTDNTLPRSRIRHTAVSLTFPIRMHSSNQYLSGMFTFGGHDGPTKPLMDGWFLQIMPRFSSTNILTSFQARWNPVSIVSDHPSLLPRWAHTLTPIDKDKMILFGGRNPVQSFNDVQLVTLRNTTTVSLPSDSLSLVAHVQTLPCTGTLPLRRFGHTASSLSLSSADGTKSDAVLIYGGFVSQFLYGEHGTNTIRFGNDNFRTDIDKYGPSMQLLNDVHILRIVTDPSTNALQGVWCQVHLDGPPLQPRFSHSMTRISDTRMVIFGGECYDPSRNQGYLFDASHHPNFDASNSIVRITVQSLPHDGISYGQYFHNPSQSPIDTSTMITGTPNAPNGDGTSVINPYRWRIHPIANLSSEYLPLSLRHTVTYLPSADSDGAGSLVLVGGGAVCFAFGAQFSRICVGDVTKVYAIAKDNLSLTNHESLLPALVVSKDKGQWVTQLLQSYGIYDPSRTAKIIDTLPSISSPYPILKSSSGNNENDDPKNLIAIPILSSKLSWLRNEITDSTDTDLRTLSSLLLHQHAAVWSRSPLPLSHRTTAAKQEKLSSQSFDSLLGTEDLYAIIEASMKRKPTVLPKVPKVTPRSGTGPAETEAFIQVMKTWFTTEKVSSEKYSLLVPGTPGGVPKRFEWVGDILMLPADAMTDPVWLQLGANHRSSSVSSTTIPIPSHYRIVTAPVFDIMAKIFHSTRIGRSNIIDNTVTRQSKVVLLRTVENVNAYALPKHDADTLMDISLPIEDIVSLYPVPDYAKLDVGTGGWVTIKENNLYYTLDVTRVMFSSGNVTEKIRMGKLNVKDETIIDLFTGIGYFTLPLLVKGNAKHVHAVDINPDAIACLRINLQVNGVPSDRYTIWPGNNRSILQRAPHLRGTADRVLLGLIPTSEGAWSVAVQLLKPQGGILHIHINKGEEELEEFIATLPRLFENLNKYSNGSYHNKEWRGKVLHVEKVKSYAPRVWHYVIDLELRER